MDNVISQLDNVLVTKEDMALTVQVNHISSNVFLSILYDLPFSMSIHNFILNRIWLSWGWDLLKSRDMWWHNWNLWMWFWIWRKYLSRYIDEKMQLCLNLKIISIDIFIFTIIVVEKLSLFSSLDKSCPGGLVPCNGNGQCDLTIGVCNCDEGHQGTDCSGNTFDNDFYST